MAQPIYTAYMMPMNGTAKGLLHTRTAPVWLQAAARGASNLEFTALDADLYVCTYVR